MLADMTAIPAILLGAAKRFTADRNFAGKIVLIFQPAEEGGGGGRVMLEEGLLDRFGIDEIYGMHNQPGLAVGSFAIRSGPMMAAGDRFVITINGRGGHAASPHLARDPVLVASHVIVALQSITSRFTDPFDPVVVSVTFISGGDRKALNVIPPAVEIGGTIRTMLPATRRTVEQRFRDVVVGTAKLYDAQAEIDWRPGYPVTVNNAEKTSAAIAAAESIVGAERVDGNWPMTMGSRIFPTCSKSGLARLSGSAMATAPIFTIRHTISMIMRSPTASIIGPPWLRNNCRS